MEQLSDEAEQGVASEQTFHRWLSDQIVESATYLSLQFTEEVLSRSWQSLQKTKLERLKEMLNPVGRTEVDRVVLRTAAEEILSPIPSILADLNRIFASMRQQTR